LKKLFFVIPIVLDFCGKYNAFTVTIQTK